jgi:hypothetical protein
MSNYINQGALAKKAFTTAQSVDFIPRIYQERGFWRYDDGRVHGEIEVPGSGSLTISDWFSATEGRGNTKAALTWIRGQGYTTIAVEQVTDKAADYWAHMFECGLIDRAVRENGVVICDRKLQSRTSIRSSRDDHYVVLVNATELLRGDAGSVGIVFSNLSGRNFTPRIGNEQTHEQWLAYMSAEFSKGLTLGLPIQMRSPEGVILMVSEIGKELPALRYEGKSLSHSM